MAFYKYNKDSQTKFTPNHFEPFLQNVEKAELWTLATDKSSEDNRIRILPAWSAEGMFAKVTNLHWGVGIMSSNFVCPNLVEVGTCPFCEVHGIMRSDYERYKVDIVSIQPKLRAYSNIIDLKRPDEGPFVFSYHARIYGPIKKFQDSGEYGDITDPQEGRDIILDRKVMGKFKFEDTVRAAGVPSKLKNPKALESLLKDLDTILPEVDMELVRVAFKSHPWKVWTPKVTAQVPESFRSTPTKLVRPEDTDPTPVKVTPPVEVNGNVTAKKLSKLDELEAKLKLNAQLKGEAA